MGRTVRRTCCVLLGCAALALTTAAQAYEADGSTPRERQVTERLNRMQLEYRVTPRPNPRHRIVWVRRWVWDNLWGGYRLAWAPRASGYRAASYARKTFNARAPSSAGRSRYANAKDKPTQGKPAASDRETRTASIDAHKLPTQTAAKSAPDAKPDLSKPLTPSEIRSAIPLGKVADPKQTLASMPIKSVWGGTIGKARSIDESGGNVKAVAATLGGKAVVKIDAAHLKYVKSRGLLMTTLSKEDAEKLPKVDRS